MLESLRTNHAWVTFSRRLGPTLLGSVFFIAAIAKITDLERFERIASTIRVLPAKWRSWVPYTVTLCELALACLLCLPETVKIGLRCAVLLLCAFTAFLIVQVFTPYAPDCNCFGLLKLSADAANENRIGLLRNAVLILVALLSLGAVSPSERTRVTAP